MGQYSDKLNKSIDEAIKDSTEPKRNKDGVLMISKDDKEGKEWYYHG